MISARLSRARCAIESAPPATPALHISLLHHAESDIVDTARARPLIQTQARRELRPRVSPHSPLPGPARSQLLRRFRSQVGKPDIDEFERDRGARERVDPDVELVTIRPRIAGVGVSVDQRIAVIDRSVRNMTIELLGSHPGRGSAMRSAAARLVAPRSPPAG